MSIRVTSRIWDEATEYSGGPLLVLLALGDWSNDEGWCWPSVPSIAKKSRLTERQVYSVIGQLEADGVIERKGGGGRGKFTKYRVLVAALGQKKNPEMASGFPGSDPGAHRGVEKPRNPEAGNSVSAAGNPEICDTKTLKSAARIIEEPSEEPPKNHQVPPVVPHADARGTRREDSDSEVCGLDPHVDAVVQACRFTQRRLRRVIAEQMRQAVDAGTPAPTVALRMIAQWRELKLSMHLLRFSWGASKFFAEGHWRTEPGSWPWDQRAVEAERNRAAARVGMA